LEQLRLVVDWAAKYTAFYAEMLSDKLESPLANIDDFFENVPILDKPTLARRVDDFTDLGELPSAVRLTGGTTVPGDSGPLLVFSSELQADYQQRLIGKIVASAPANQRALHLHISNGSHGTGGVPTTPGLFTLPLRKTSQLDAILLVLRRRFVFEDGENRVSRLFGSINLIKALTLALQERGISSQQFAIRYLSVSGWYLSARWRRLLEDYWQCPVLELYGLSEVPGLVCARGSNDAPYTFNGPVYLELLDLKLGLHVQSGPARLVATPLLPHAATQPLLRYDTGDIVEASDWSPFTLERRFQLHGRASMSQVIDLGAGPCLLLSAIDAQAVLGDVPDVAVKSHPLASLLGLKSAMGWPIYNIRLVDQGLVKRLLIDVELRYSPHEFPERAVALRNELARALRDRSSSLERAVHTGAVSLDVTCHPPGAVGHEVIV